MEICSGFFPQVFGFFPLFQHEINFSMENVCLPSFRPAKAVPHSGLHSFSTFSCVVSPSLSLHRCFIVILVVLPIVLSICCLFLSPSEFFPPPQPPFNLIPFFFSSKQHFDLHSFFPSKQPFQSDFFHSTSTSFQSVFFTLLQQAFILIFSLPPRQLFNLSADEAWSEDESVSSNGSREGCGERK